MDKKKTIVRALVTSDGLSLSCVQGEYQMRMYVGAAWGLANYQDETGQSKGYGFFGAYNVTPALTGCDALELNLMYGQVQTFSLKVDGADIPTENISRLCFFANTDIGIMLVSYQPRVFEDARELIMTVTAKPKWQQVLQHLAVGWAYELFRR